MQFHAVPFIARFALLFLAKFGLNIILSRSGKTTKDYSKLVSENPVLVIIFGPITEELMFRWFPIWLGADSVWHWMMILSSICFAAAHLPNFQTGQVGQFFKYFLMACIYAWVALAWGLIFAILMHMLNNGIAWFLTSRRTLRRV